MNVLILSPHTDDAEISAGGTIARFLEEGHNLLWVVFSPCEESFPDFMDKNTLKNEFIEVMKSLNANYILYDYKVRKLHEVRQKVLEHLREVRDSFLPDLVIGPSLNDFHQDHKVVANEMVRAFKTSASIICYEQPRNYILFNTQAFVVLKERHLLKKIELVNLYKSQMRLRQRHFNDDFVRGLAVVRGSQVDREYAEAFEVIRWKINLGVKKSAQDESSNMNFFI